MIDYTKEFGNPDYAVGSRQTQVAATFRIVYGWMCAERYYRGVACGVRLK